MLDLNLIDRDLQDAAGSLDSIEEVSGHEIAIIGIAAQLPLVEDDLDQFWEFLKNGVDFISAFPDARRRDVETYVQAQARGEGAATYFDGAYLDQIDAFDHAFFRLSPKEASLMTPNQRLFLQTTWKAIEDAGYSRTQLAGRRVGVFVGFNADTLHDYKKMIAELEPASLSLAVPGNLSSIIAGRISYLYDFKGPSVCVDTACSSSLVAVHLACQALRNEECEMAVAGSVKVNLVPLANELRIGIESAEWRSRPFDARADGIGTGEGVVTLVLKPLHRAIEEGDAIYAVLKGSAVNQDGSSVGITAPNALAQEDVLARAWQDAGVDPASISYIETHGTGTKLGDPIEIDGIQRAFARFTDRKQFVAIGSVKANLGHLDHAAGVVGLLKAILALQHRQLPPLVHFTAPNENVPFIDSPVYVNDTLADWDTDGQPRRCGISAFGMSGTNCHVVLEEAPAPLSASPQQLAPHLLTLSARTAGALTRLVGRLAQRVYGAAELEDLCYTAQIGRDHYQHRLALVFQDEAELTGQLARLTTHGLANDEPSGIFYGAGRSVVATPTAAAHGADDQRPRHTGQADALLQDLIDDGPRRAILLALAQLYAEGATIAWGSIYRGQQRRRLHLPTYSFDPVRCWLAMPEPMEERREGRSTTALPPSGPPAQASVALQGADNGVYSPTERRVAAVWGAILGLRQIDIAANFYELGGDSILALKIVHLISEQLGVQLGVADLLAHPSVSELAIVVDQHLQAEPASEVSSALVPVEPRAYYPLTASQTRSYILHQFDPNGIGQNAPFCVWADGELDPVRFAAVFARLIGRHEALRTSFEMVDEQPVQRIADRVQFAVAHYACDEQQLSATIAQFIQPFDLTMPPLLRVGLVQVSPTRHLIMVDMHHSVTDGVSSTILFKEFCALYDGQELPPLPLQYRDFAVWQYGALRGGALTTQRDYWLDKLSGELPVLAMPAAADRTRQGEPRARTTTRAISLELTEALEQLARSHNVTLHALLFAAYASLLHHYSGQEDLLVGTLVAGRQHPDLEGLVGVFINFLPIRLRPQANQPFATFLAMTSHTLLDAYNHDYPFDQLVADLKIKPRPARNPLYDTMFVFHNEFQMNPLESLRVQEGNLRFADYPLYNPDTALDFKLDAWRAASGALTFVLHYNAALYADAFMLQMLDDLCALLHDLRLDQPLSRLLPGRAGGQVQAPPQAALLPQLGRPLSLAVAATFTAEPITPHVAWWCNAFGLDLDVRKAGYHQVFQELYNPTGVLRSNQGANLLLVRFEDWIRDDSLSDEARIEQLERVYAELSGALRAVSRTIPWLVGLFPIADHLALSPRLVTTIRQLNRRWQQTLAALSNVQVVDFGATAALYGVGRVFDPLTDREGHLPFSDEYVAAIGATLARALVARQRQPFKVIVLDCDNVLWSGVCGEDGPLGITIGPAQAALQRFMLECMQAGMLLALCSKNNEADVWEVFERNPDMVLRKHHLAGWRINWGAKSDNIAQLAEELSLGLDGFIFIDDSALECSEMMLARPSVLTLHLPADPAHQLAYLRHVWAFDSFAMTAEDAKRTQYYRAEAQRQEAQATSAGSVDDFLHSLDLKVRIGRLTPDQLPRAAQLTQRTNQFNMSTIRRTEAALASLLSSPGVAGFGVHVEDRFGDYGFVGLVIGRAEAGRFVLDTFLLSCRAMGRRVEDSILTALKRHAIENGLEALCAPFVPTAKNHPFEEFLHRGPWTRVTQHEETVEYVSAVQAIADRIEHVALLDATALPAIPGTAHGPVVDALATSSAEEDPQVADLMGSGELSWPVLEINAQHLLHRAYLLPLQHPRAAQLVELVAEEEQRRRDVGGITFVAPATETERVLSDLWRSVLHLDTVGVDDHFFDSGGNSLQAISALAKIQRSLGVEVTVRDLFEAPTVRQLARFIEQATMTRSRSEGQEERGAAESQIPPLLPLERTGAQPLSFAQQGLWFLDQLEPHSSAYNVPLAVRLEGSLNLLALARSLDAIVARHEVLRTTFVAFEGEPRQVIHPALSLTLPVIDLQGLPDGGRADELLRLEQAEAKQPFDLAKGPLVRLALVRLDPVEQLLLVTFHHSVFDGWTLTIFARDLGALYGAMLHERPVPLSPLPVQYADYAIWQRRWLRGALLERQLAYWQRQLAGAPTVLALPTDRPRPAVQTFQGATYDWILPADRLAALQALSRQEGVTLFMTLLAAFQTLLSRYSGQEDIVVGSTFANRTQPELESLVGFFVNTLVLRTDLSGNPSFRALLGRVREVCLDAFAHQDAPFEMVVDAVQPERSLSHAPLFQVLFVLDNAPVEPLILPELRLELVALDQASAKFDLTLSCMEGPQGLHGTLEYNTDLFDRSTMVRLLGHLQTLLEGIIAHPEWRLQELPLLPPAEQAELLVAWNATRIPYPDLTCPHQCFEAQVLRTPHAVALVHADHQLTYGTLNRRANQLAHYLRQHGVGPEVRVGICMERTPEMVVGLLAILKAGGAYVPLDPSYPQERLAFMLADAQVRVLLSHSHLSGRLPTSGSELICVDSDWPRIAQGPTHNPPPGVRPSNLAYTIYTSGSTGRPKGTGVAHRGTAALLAWAATVFAPDELAWVLFSTSISFDVSVFELFVPLSRGGTVVLVDTILALAEPHAVAYAPTLISTVPSALTELLRLQPLGRSVGTVCLAGEQLGRELVQQLYQSGTVERVYNLYGPTEDTTYSIYTLISRHQTDQPPIGRPIANSQAYVLDRAMAPVPIGVPGELYLGGDGLARGYPGRPDLSAERFVVHPHSNEPGSRLYRTGDLARYRPDGRLEYLGRLDHQVKVHGFRIELGEIEAVLEGHPGVRQAVVLARKDRPDETRLVAYLVPAAHQQLHTEELRHWLGITVPQYMVPSAFVLLDALPLTPNGKLDRRALPAPDADRPDLTSGYVAPRTATEALLAGIWGQVLGRTQVGVQDNFFALGGDSILSIQVIARASQAGMQLTVRQFFEQQTIAGQAAVAVPATPLQAEQGLVRGVVPLTPIEQWFFAQDLPAPHHFNQALLLQLAELRRPALLKPALQHLLQHHDALRLRFGRGPEGWEQALAAPQAQPIFQVLDLERLSAEQQRAAIEQQATLAQASLDLAQGPLLRAVFFALGGGQPDRLLLVAHHLVIDGVSWRILLEDLYRIYAQLEQGASVTLPAKTSSFQAWARRLHEYAHAAELLDERSYWLDPCRAEVAPLPVDYPGGENTVASARTLSFSLSMVETQQLLQDVPHAFHTQINDVLITALAQALTKWMQAAQVLVDLEGHGRGELFPELDFSRTVGWFTSLCPVLLDLQDCTDPLAALKAVKEQLRAIPRRGIGYGVLRYLRGDAGLTQALASLPAPELSFNYLGQFDQLLPVEAGIELAPESSGPAQGPDGRRSHLLAIDIVVSGGQLRLNWQYSANCHAQATIEQQALTFLAALRTLIARCTVPGVGGYTPSDFPLARLTQSQLDRLTDLVWAQAGASGYASAGSVLADVYPLSPLQQGLLFHSLYAPNAGAYIEQLSWTVEGRFDTAAFIQAWALAIERHTILRSSFHWKGLEQPVQIVHPRVALVHQQDDWCDQSPATQQERLADLLARDRAAGYVLEQAPLLRLWTVRLAEQRYQVIWSFHHLLLDGWSVSLLLREVQACYLAICGGQQPVLPPARPYRDYLAWLGQQDLAAAEQYWRAVLAGLQAPTILGLGGIERPVVGEPRYAEIEQQVPPTLTADLQRLAREEQLTLNTLVQAAWALLLSHYTGSNDVLFGATVAGRPAELGGVEERVGLFINTLPVRVRLPAATSVRHWLRQLQAAQMEARRYEYTPLAQVQEWSTLPTGVPLFESLLVFENYPVAVAVAQQAQQGVMVREVRFMEQTNYPLTLQASPGDCLTLHLSYDGGQFAPDAMTRLLGHLEDLLAAITANPDRPVGEVQLSTRRSLPVEPFEFSFA
jgi:amino acid adenylation domain-containing protein/FkbH-like protein/non-ribosomal peptide synthase protein (TIGR01720 family)